MLVIEINDPHDVLPRRHLVHESFLTRLLLLTLLLDAPPFRLSTSSSRSMYALYGLWTRMRRSSAVNARSWRSPGPNQWPDGFFRHIMAHDT